MQDIELEEVEKQQNTTNGSSKVETVAKPFCRDSSDTDGFEGSRK